MSHITATRYRQDEKTAYTLASRYLLRWDPDWTDCYTAFDIATGQALSLSAAGFLVAVVLEQSPKTLKNILAYLESRECPISLADIEKWFREANKEGLIQKYLSHMEIIQPPPLTEPIRVDASIPVTSLPTDAEIHWTDGCNLRCHHCFIRAEQQNVQGLPYAAWSKIFDSLEGVRLRQLVVSGGEPLMHKHANELLKDLASRRIKVDVLTNGTLITDRMLESVASDTMSFSVSLDGASADTHNMLRGKGAFDRTISGIRALANQNVSFSISMTVHRHNVDQMAPLVDLVLHYGAQGVAFLLLDNVGRAENNPELWLTIAQRYLVLDTYEKLKAIYSKDLSLYLLDPSSCEFVEATSGGVSRNISCAAGTKRIAIRSDGAVFPCVYAFDKESFRIGTLPHDNLIRVWQSDRWEAFRGSVSVDDLPTCRDCNWVDGCYAKHCRLRALYSSGDFYGVPPGCKKYISGSDK